MIKSISLAKKAILVLIVVLLVITMFFLLRKTNEITGMTGYVVLEGQNTDNIIDRESSVSGIPAELINAQIKHESNFNAKAVSHDCGAVGMMQLMPGTAKSLGLEKIHKNMNYVTCNKEHSAEIEELAKTKKYEELIEIDERFDAEKNIMAGAKYMAQLLNQFNGDVALALAAYNAGPGRVKRSCCENGCKTFAECKENLPLQTQGYVIAICKEYGNCGEIIKAEQAVQGVKQEGVYYVAPSFKIDLPYNFSYYAELRDKTRKLVSQVSKCQNIKQCLQDALKEKEYSSWKLGKECEKPIEQLFYDISENINLCAQEKGKTCNIIIPKTINDFDGEYVFAIENKGISNSEISYETLKEQIAQPYMFFSSKEALEKDVVFCQQSFIVLNYKNSKLSSTKIRGEKCINTNNGIIEYEYKDNIMISSLNVLGQNVLSFVNPAILNSPWLDRELADISILIKQKEDLRKVFKLCAKSDEELLYYDHILDIASYTNVTYVFSLDFNLHSLVLNAYDKNLDSGNIVLAWNNLGARYYKLNYSKEMSKDANIKYFDASTAAAVGSIGIEKGCRLVKGYYDECYYSPQIVLEHEKLYSVGSTFIYIMELEDNVNYSMAISQLDGQLSKTVNITSIDDMPPMMVENNLRKEISDGNITIAWNTPLNLYGKELNDLKGYYIIYSEYALQQLPDFLNSCAGNCLFTTDNTIKIENLLPNTEYEILIIAVDNNSNYLLPYEQALRFNDKSVLMYW